jgi:hypothetical protein
MALGIGSAIAISGGANLLGGLFGGLFGGKKPKVPGLERIDAGNVQQQTIQQNQENLAATEQLGREVNRANVAAAQQVLDLSLPGQREQATQNVLAQLRGEIPTDVAQQIGRTSAAQGFNLGVQGSQLGRNLTARDLGLTSLQIQQQGLQNMAGLAQLTTPTPFKLQDMFFSPEQRLTFEQNERNARFSRDVLAAGVAAAPSRMQASMGNAIQNFAQDVGQIGVFSAGMGNPQPNVIGQPGSGYAGPVQPTPSTSSQPFFQRWPYTA